MKYNLYATDMEKLQRIIGCDYDFLLHHDLTLDDSGEHIVVNETTVQILKTLWDLKLQREAIFALVEKYKQVPEKYIN